VGAAAAARLRVGKKSAQQAAHAGASGQHVFQVPALRLRERALPLLDDLHEGCHRAKRLLHVMTELRGELLDFGLRGPKARAQRGAFALRLSQPQRRPDGRREHFQLDRLHQVCFGALRQGYGLAVRGGPGDRKDHRRGKIRVGLQPTVDLEAIRIRQVEV
jgi:hypothetical protein